MVYSARHSQFTGYAVSFGISERYKSDTVEEEALTEVSFGEWLKRQRSARGLTQEQFAHQIGCAAITLRKIEAEERRPSAQMAERMADILNIPQNERTSFLRYARGELRYAPEESAPETPWHISTSPRSNLPAPSSSLIGREQVIAEIHQYLTRGDIRLVTLIGPPGIGKTRLSIESARQSLAAFPDGVFFVALAPLDDPRLVAPTIVQTLGFVEAGRQSAMEYLQRSIGEKQMLVVLDNCEHLIEEVAALVSVFLSSCSRLKILTTSRESLRIPGEWLYSVPTLNIPKEYSVLDVETASKFPAVALFVARARAVRPDFSLTINNVQTIAAICTELDGLPLAIELIAARLRLMSPDALLARLNDQFTLHADGMRAPTGRQKTLNNAIGWSFDLLSAEEQTLFAQLSVFSGGFTLEAAEAIFSRSMGSKSVAELIALLLDKSLLQRTMDNQVEGEVRFDMLTVIQQFALDRLGQMGREAETRDGHLDYFLALAEKAEPFLTSEKRPLWLERLKRDYDNIRGALTWAQGTEKGLRLVGALRWFWDFAGMVAEGRNWAERVLEASDERNTASRAKALWSAGSMAWHQGDYAAARPWLEESARIWRMLIAQTESENQQHDMKQGLARTLRKLGNLAYSEKNFVAANSLKEESIALFREVGPRWDLALDLRVFGQLLAERQKFELARRILAESTSLFQQENDPWGIGIASIGLASLDLRLNDFEQANKHLKESITAILQSPNLATIARCLALLGIVAAKEQEPKRAAQLFGIADKILEDEGLSGLSQQILYPGMIEEGIQTARQQLDEKDFAKEWAKGRAMTVEQAISYALEDSSS